MQPKPNVLPGIFFKFGQQVIHIVGLPVFFFLFCILYRPFGSPELLNFAKGSFAFNTTIITAIIFVVLLITRIALWGLGHTDSFRRRTYYIWCGGELVITALFISLYIHLISGKMYSFIDIFPFAFAGLTGILIYPYIIITLVLESDIISKYTSMATAESEDKLKFCDEKHNLKFITEPKALVFIESNENYCVLHYLDNGKMMKYQLRSPLKKIEEITAPYGIIQCHRSYLVNVKHIRSLIKENGLIRAQMDMSGIEDIPVTPRFYTAITDLM